MCKKNKGITLVSLIATIIILTILTAVSIGIVINGNIFDKANHANEIIENETIKSNEELEKITEDWETINSISYLDLSVPGEINIENKYYKSEQDTSYAIIPKGFTVSGISTEQSVENGLVIYDIPEDVDTTSENFWTETTTIGGKSYPSVQCNYNQFVWVPVETAYVTAADLEKIISESEGTITTEKAAMQSLVDKGIYPMAVELPNGKDYRGILYGFTEGTDKVQITVKEFSTIADYNDGSVIYYREPAKLSSDNTSQINQTKEQTLELQTEYNNIVKSTAKYKGFWVARYELSYNSTTEKGESKRGKTVAAAADTATNKWYGLYDVCKAIYTANKISEKQSEMIYGSQWDQIMIWMKDVKNINDTSKFYILDSSYMGNYTTDSGGTSAKQVSGYEDNYSVKKIFDLGGNLYDWVVEANYTWGRTLKGRCYQKDNAVHSASNDNGYPPEASYAYVSTRAALYLLP